jgi:4'-phosphopantetheinyl transferase
MCNALREESHVWLAGPQLAECASRRTRYEALLSSAELQRYRRFHFQRDQHLYLVAHALVRTTLSRYVDVAPECWQFSVNRYGRPEIDAAQGALAPLRFNLSHTHGLAACIVTQLVDCGVDVEREHDLDDMMTLAKTVFSRHEREALAAVPTAGRKSRFFDYWTLKESYIKARGMGLSLPLDAFSFQFVGERLAGVDFDLSLQDDPAQWQFEVDRIGASHHKLAVAIRRGDSPERRVMCRYIEP